MLEIFHTSFLLLFHTRFGSVQSDGSDASSAELLLADVNCFDPSVRTIENTQSASPLCLPNNYHWNALAGRTTKTDDQRSSLRVVEDGLEQLRRVKGKLWSATILILRSYLILKFRWPKCSSYKEVANSKWQNFSFRDLKWKRCAI